MYHLKGRLSLDPLTMCFVFSLQPTENDSGTRVARKFFRSYPLFDTNRCESFETLIFVIVERR